MDNKLKKKLLFFIIFLHSFFALYAQVAAENDFEFKFIFGAFGGGMNVFSNEYDFEVSAGLLNFFVEHGRTNIGFELSPLNYKMNYSANTRKWKGDLYFLNGNLYWNPFAIKNIILGPFVSINYLSVDDSAKFNTDNYIFGSGLRFLLRTCLDDGKYPFQIIGSEVGYRNLSGKHSFYFTVSLDITILAGIIVATLTTEGAEVIQANEDYERQINGTGPFVPREPKQPKLPFQNDREID